MSEAVERCPIDGDARLSNVERRWTLQLDLSLPDLEKLGFLCHLSARQSLAFGARQAGPIRRSQFIQRCQPRDRRQSGLFGKDGAFVLLKPARREFGGAGLCEQPIAVIHSCKSGSKEH